MNIEMLFSSMTNLPQPGPINVALGIGQLTESAALMMTRRVSFGREICGTWEERTSLVCAPARLAMNRCVAGGMAWSSLATRYHDGIVFQAGVPDTLSKAACENGRWVAYIWSATRRGTSAANAVRTPSRVR